MNIPLIFLSGIVKYIVLNLDGGVLVDGGESWWRECWTEGAQAPVMKLLFSEISTSI